MWPKSARHLKHLGSFHHPHGGMLLMLRGPSIICWATRARTHGWWGLKSTAINIAAYLQSILLAMQTKKFDTSLWGSSACRKLINCLMCAIFHQMTQHPSHAMDRLDPVHNLGGTPFCLGFPIAPPLFPLSISNLIHVFHCLSVRSNSVYSCLFSMLYWFHLGFSQATHIPAPPWIVDVVD